MPQGWVFVVLGRLECVRESSLPFVALACEGGVKTVVSMTEVELVLEVDLEIAGDVELEEKAVLEHGLPAFVAPGVDAVHQLLLMSFRVVDNLLENLRRGSFHDEEAHEIELVAEGDVAVPCKLELMAQGEACAKVVAAHGEVVRSCTSQGNG